MDLDGFPLADPDRLPVTDDSTATTVDGGMAAHFYEHDDCAGDRNGIKPLDWLKAAEHVS
ncbi:hypothetical protein [Methylobacterium trifolii]|nr:hypothetical protein [Methylobacterium trifolii]